MDQIVEYILAALLVFGGIFGIVGSYGLLKLPTMLQRLHAPTKATTLGVGSALITSMAYFWFFENTISWHELMITLFLLLTAPITANFIAKAQLHRAVNKEDLPATGVGTQWATFDPEVQTVNPALLDDRDPG
ncbi:MAG: Na+/H+ antiporter subunit G [Paracoccaceae bacterium]